jgi:hypothetical protein
MTIIHKNIIGFDVPMHDVVLREDLKRFNHLPEVEESAFLNKGPFLLQQFIKSSAVAVFIDEVEVISSFEHIDVFDDVGAALKCR